MRKIFIVSVLLALGSNAAATSLKDFWSTRPLDDPHFQSAKSSLALEKCLALEISEEVGVPLIIRGEQETIITGIAGGLAMTPIAGARIVDGGASREVFVGAIHSRGFRDKLSRIVQGCL